MISYAITFVFKAEPAQPENSPDRRDLAGQVNFRVRVLLSYVFGFWVKLEFNLTHLNSSSFFFFF